MFVSQKSGKQHFNNVKKRTLNISKMGWIEWRDVQTNSEQNIGQVGNPKTRKEAETTVDSSPLEFRYSRDRDSD